MHTCQFDKIVSVWRCSFNYKVYPVIYSSCVLLFRLDNVYQLNRLKIMSGT